MKKICIILIGIMFFYVIEYPTRTFAASQNGLLLWFNRILPALLPFSILSNIVLAVWGDRTQNSRRILRISLPEWFVIIGGFCFGFPIGSKLSSDIGKSGHTDQKRAQILAGFTNNMSPAFVSTYVCTDVLGRPELTLFMYAVLYGPPLVIGTARLAAAGRSIPAGHNSERDTQKNTASRFRIDMQIIDAGITNSFLTLMKLCGYIVMFSITADMILHIRFLPALLRTALVGIFEATNGIAQLSYLAYPESVKILLAVLFLSIGGLSGIAQTNAMLSFADMSLAVYVKDKLCYTCCSIGLALLAILLFFF